MLGTITTHIDIEKLNERGKKMLNAKLERHLARPHTLPYEVSAYIYIYILIDWTTLEIYPQFFINILFFFFLSFFLSFFISSYFKETK